MIEVLKQMLEVLEYWDVHGGLHQPTEEAIEAGRKAIAELEIQEPVAWRAPNWGHSADEYVYRDFDDPVIGVDGKPSPNNEPLYAHPPQRKPLTDEYIEDLYFDGFSISKLKDFARAIEAAHGIKE